VRKRNEDKIEIFINKILKLLHIKMSKSGEQLFVQIFKFIIVGGIATIIDWCIYFVLYNYFKINPLLSNICSFSISVIYNYYASVKWVFNVDGQKSKKRIFLEFIIFSLIGLALTEIIIYLGVDKLKIDAMFVKIFATVLVMIFNFVTRKMFLE